MAKTLTVYQYPQCGTCRSAVKQLKEQGCELELINIKENPPTEDELRALITASGLPIAKFFNTSGEVYKTLGLKDRMPKLTEEEKLTLLASNGMLIKRPIVTDGRIATVGFREEELAKAYGEH